MWPLIMIKGTSVHVNDSIICRPESHTKFPEVRKQFKIKLSLVRPEGKTPPWSFSHHAWWQQVYVVWATQCVFLHCSRHCTYPECRRNSSAIMCFKLSDETQVTTCHLNLGLHWLILFPLPSIVYLVTSPYLSSNLLSLSLFLWTWVCTVISHQEITQLGVLPSCTPCSAMPPPPAARVTFQNRRSETFTALSIWPQFIFCFHHTIFFI